MLLHIILLSSVVYAAVAQETSNEIVQTENVTQETTNATVGSKLVNTCSESEWQCADGGCISKQGRCNAVVDCGDSSDEYLDTCEGIVRPIFRLQMLCFAPAAKSRRICPQICYDQPAFCYYALMAENGRPNTCRFPKYPDHGRYTVQPLADRPGQEGFRLDYTCDPSYSLIETGKLECVNGAWLEGDSQHYCKVEAETCKLDKGDNFTYVCQGSPCGDLVPVGTVVTVTRRETKTCAPVSVHILCQENKVFNISTDCVNEIDRLQQEYENPTMIKLVGYESKFNELKNNDTTRQFQTLVEEFQHFDDEVRGNLNKMYRQTEECDLYLDLFLHKLLVKHRESVA